MNCLYKVLFLFLLFSNSAFGTHIIGGEATYKCIATDSVLKTSRFTVTYTIYRDDIGNGAAFDFPARFGVFEKQPSSSIWSYLETKTAPPTDIGFVSYGDPCVVIPPNIRIEKATYNFNVTLPWSQSTYRIVYQRCCRNTTISNIITPGVMGFALDVEIKGNAISTCNNSPSFNKFPPILVCNQKPLNFDHSATDIDGDSLVYEFCVPYHAGGPVGSTVPGSPNACDGVTPDPFNCPPPYPDVTFSSIYSVTNPMGGSPQVKINSNSGQFSGVPNTLGQFLVAVCAKEYRNGLQIGAIRREFQFNVVNCIGISSNQTFSICPGDSVVVNDTIYKLPGDYTQNFQSVFGCDSTLNIKIIRLNPTADTLQFGKCDRDSVLVNNIYYHTTGVFTQKFVNSVGCDSILTIKINELRPTFDSIHVAKCEGDSIIVNGIFYNSSGIYTQNFVNALGCDSILTISVNILKKSSGTLNFQICQGEIALVNGIEYTSPGEYFQTLQNQNGCDSILRIKVNKGTAFDIKKTLSLCDTIPLVINGQNYSQPGEYVFNFLTVNGCDSIITYTILPCNQNIIYDFENCDAMVLANSMVYDEFTPRYISQLDCGSIQASNVFRTNPQMNKHSCTEGQNSTVTMCVSASTSCNYETPDVTPITFEVLLNPNDQGRISLNHIIFHQKAPTRFSWIGGLTADNNYPTKYGIRIYKNNVLAFEKREIPTTRDWTKEKYDLYDDSLFVVSDSTLFRIELLPYCPAGVRSSVSAWDIDNLSVYFSCREIQSRMFSGKVENSTEGLSNITMRRIHNNSILVTTTVQNGNFLFPKNKLDLEYTLGATSNDSILYGISVQDVLLMQKHILGSERFTNPLQYLAADINNDQVITVSDLVELKKVLLRVQNQFNKSDSWLFLDMKSVKEITNPWDIKRQIFIPKGNRDLLNLNFLAVKVGDIDGALELWRKLIIR
ncbi:MAG: hypothetical protein IPO14_11815 [Saprospiraceae bacterium]|nr:hypothetical protein [Saprospiraceae bacterium]